MAANKSTPSARKFKSILQRFAVHLCARRGLTDCTIHGYVGTVRRIVPLMGFHPTHRALDHYIVKMRQSGASYSHVTNTSLGIERYMEFIHDPIRLGRPKKPKPIIRDVLSEAEITLMIAACRTLRERTILSLLAYSGLRNKELCELWIRDIDIANQMVRVQRGKGQKDRNACIAPPCIAVLLLYLAERKASTGDRLFVTIRRGNVYRQQDLRKLIHVVARRAGITRRVYPHLFRHSLATNMLSRGAGLFAIKEQLGHAFIETTMIYLHSVPQRMQMEYRMFAPSYL